MTIKKLLKALTCTNKLQARKQWMKSLASSAVFFMANSQFIEVRDGFTILTIPQLIEVTDKFKVLKNSQSIEVTGEFIILNGHCR